MTQEHNYDPHKKHWFWAIIRHFAPLYIHVGVASFLVNIFALAMPLFVMNVYDRIVPNNAFESLWALSFGIIIVMILDFILKSTRAYFVDTAGRNTDIIMLGKFMDVLSDVRLDSMPTQSVGSLLAKMREFEYIRDFMGSTTLIALVDFPFILLYLALITLLGGWLVIVPLCAIPILLCFTFLAQYSFRQATKEQLSLSVKKNALLGEIAAGFETMRSSRLDKALSKRWDNIIDVTSDSVVKTKLLGVGMANINVFVNSLASVSLVIVGVYLIAAGQMSMGALIACVILLGRCTAPLTSLVGVIGNIHKAKIGLETLDTLLKLPRESIGQKEIEENPLINFEKEEDNQEVQKRGLLVDIIFEDVSFKYPSTSTMQTTSFSLSGINLKIAKGEHIALIGKTGSGKSTLTRLAAGLYLPTTGRTFFGTVEASIAPMRTIRKNIGVLPQNVVLFSGTIRSNICDAWPDDVPLTEEALLELATLCGVMDFASKHPLGLDMPIGEHSLGLSGGQIQSVGLARALAGNPEIIILDEPSSNLDTQSEQMLIQRLEPYLKGKTLILSTHRHSMLALADKAISLEDGRIEKILPIKKVAQQPQEVASK